MRTNIDLNTENFAFLDSSRFKTNEWFIARIKALDFSDEKCNFPSCLSSLVNVTPRYLNFFNCFNDTPYTCRKNWTEFLGRSITSVLEVLIFIPAMSHAAAKPFNACWRPDSEEASKTKSSAKSNRLELLMQVISNYCKPKAYMHPYETFNKKIFNFCINKILFCRLQINCKETKLSEYFEAKF